MQSRRTSDTANAKKAGSPRPRRADASGVTRKGSQGVSSQTPLSIGSLQTPEDRSRRRKEKRERRKWLSRK